MQCLSPTRSNPGTRSRVFRRTNSTFQNTLSYNCTCNNGTAPGLQYYDQTLPYFICNQAYIDCIAANENNKNGQDECKESIVCLKNPPKKADAATTSTAAATPTGGSATTGAGSQATQTPASSSSTAFAAPTAIPALYGNAAAVAAMGLFAYMI